MVRYWYHIRDGDSTTEHSDFTFSSYFLGGGVLVFLNL